MPVEIVMSGVAAEVQSNGVLKILKLQDPLTHLTVVIPLDLASARTISAALETKLVVPATRTEKDPIL